MSSASVFIVIGPEWAPMRAHFCDRMSELLPPLAGPISVARLEAVETSPTARVANWIANACNEPDWQSTIVVPGESPVHSETIQVGRWVSVTELLLDPEPAQAEQLYAIGIWTRFVSRRERLKLRVSPTLPDAIAANAARFSPVLSVLIGEWQGQHILIAGTDVIATEVTARALRAIDQPAGATGMSPWQAPIVQSAIERSMGVTNGSLISVSMHFGEPIAPLVREAGVRVIEQVSQAIDATVGVS